METLGEAFPKQQARLRELLTEYRELGPVGQFGHMMIEDTLRQADRAVITGDVVEMLRVYERMKECQ